MESLEAFPSKARGGSMVSARASGGLASARLSGRVSARLSGRVSSLAASMRSSFAAITSEFEETIQAVNMTMLSMKDGFTRATIYWPAVIMGALMVIATSGQGLFLSVATEPLEECKVQASETMLLGDLVLVASSGLVLLGMIGWRRATEKAGSDDEAQGGDPRTLSFCAVSKCVIIKLGCVGAMGTVDNIMYLLAMTYHTPATVMILRLAGSLVLLTVGQTALKMLKSTPIQIFGLLPLVLSAAVHILIAAAEAPAGEDAKPPISTKVEDLIVLVCCPATAAAEVLGTDLLFAPRGQAKEENAEQTGATPSPMETPASTETSAGGALPDPVLAFLLNSTGAALMDVCIHLGFSEGRFPINSFGCTEGVSFVFIAATYVLAYKMAMVFCGGMASVVLRVINPMLTYAGTCLLLKESPKVLRSLSGLAVLTMVAWYNIAPIWDSHVSLIAQKKTIDTAIKRVTQNLRTTQRRKTGHL